MEVSSHLIKAIFYDPQTRTLDVEIRLKGRRRYFNVPSGVVKNLLSAQSPGWYYTQHIRHAYPRAADDDHPPWYSFPWLRHRRHH